MAPGDQPHPDAAPKPRGYALEAVTLPRPDLPGRVAVLESDDDAIDLLARDLLAQANESVRRLGDFHLALSGDPALERLYIRIILDPAFRWLPWKRTHLWLVHERSVPFDDERSCARVLREIIADHADLPPEQFHPIFACAEDATDRATRDLRRALAWRERGEDRLDAVVLALGGDGAVGGWTMHSPPVGAPGAPSPDRSGARDGPVRPLYHRVSADDGDDAIVMGQSLVNGARSIAVLAVGAAVAPMIATLAERHAAGAMPSLPAEFLSPVSGALTWYLDRAAVEPQGALSE